MKNLRFLLGALLLISLTNCSFSQKAIEVPMNEETWEVMSEEYKFETYLGVESIYLPKGRAKLKGVDFYNGIIEFDIAFPQGRGFPGLLFRMQDDQNYEELYVRPHQSGNPDANQYTPVFNGLAGWQLYHGDGHGAPVEYKYDNWNHVKLVISGTVGEVFINDMSKPLFQIHELKFGDKSGPVALKGNANSHFANFKYTKTDNPTLMLESQEKPKIEANVIQSYSVSEAVEDAAVIAKSWLDKDLISSTSWTRMSPEYTGTINVARVASRSEKKNTALVKILIESDKDQIKRMEFGYSDNAQVFVNGQSVYLGNNTFRTRDYRYLGTIGYFDSVFLHLKKGENEIVVALNEAFGGWGMKARLEDMEGVTIK